MKVAIIGGGVAGLSSALFLREYLGSRISGKISILERKPVQDIIRSTSSINVGVWSTALNAIHFLENGTILRELESKGRYMTEAGYRNPSGQWLATTRLSETLHDCENDVRHPVSLLFLQENDLKSTLLTAVSNYHSSIEIVTKNIDKTSLPLIQEEYDVVLGCDGAESVARKFAFNNNEFSALKSKPYVVFRGNSMSIQCPAFQTWGYSNYMRFAFVPTINGSVWFATVAKDLIEDTNPWNPSMKSSLLDIFGSWHAPIADLIGGSTSSIMVEQAYGLDYGTAAESLAKDINLTLIGDAGHCCDPVLAQGFTVAIEDAAEVAFHLQQVEPLNAVSALRAYEESRKTRMKSLWRTTAVVTQLAHLQRPLANIRNISLKLTPEPVKRRILDFVMRKSISPQPKLWI